MTESTSFPLFESNPSTLLTIIGGISSCLFLFYRWALPRPIPGIPYNKEATKSLLGDIIPMVKYISRTQEVGSYWSMEAIKLQSPIIQLFSRPFRKPMVLISDFRESQDIMLRRTKEFDRANTIDEIFSGILPDHHFIMKTNDKFKQHRRWLQDIMTHDFLHQVAAPRVYTAFGDLMGLWGEKTRLAEGHPFAPAEDVYRAALDAAWNVIFGANPSNNATRLQLEYCASIKAIEQPGDKDKEVHIPHAQDPAIFKAVITLTDSLAVAVQSPLPAEAHWVIRQFPYMRKAKAVKDKFMKEEVEKSLQRFAGKGANEIEATCGKDEILRREMLLSEKEGRAPLYHSKGMYDEMFGFIVAAHDTTSTSIVWTLKMLADHQRVQDKLRSTLYSSFSTAKLEARPPTCQEILKLTIPYLDAVIEEAFRYSRTVPTIVRTTTVDAIVLGAVIPKNTEVLLLAQGPSLFSPAFPIDDKLRSAGCLAAKDRIGSWDPEDIGQFIPERWLREEKGNMVFDAASGPLLTFGLGPRGCFGRRLAYLEMRLMVVALLWGFELQKCPEELSGLGRVDGLTSVPQQCYVRLRKL